MSVNTNFSEWLKESSGETFKPPRNVPYKFDHTKHPELAEEFYSLISTAYSEIGGHVKIKAPEDIFKDPKWNFWAGVDIHGTQDFDIVIFGQKTRYGIKYSGVGHDGTTDAKKFYLASRGEDLKKLGYFAETSGKLAEILQLKYKVPAVNTEEEVEKVLGKPVKWVGKREDTTGDGWYIRNIGGKEHHKILLGRPKV